MTATIRFNLNDQDDKMAHMRCLKSLDMALVLWNFSAKLRRICDESEDGKYIDEELVRTAFYDLLMEHDINLDTLVV
jgi:hypothetical protein